MWGTIDKKGSWVGSKVVKKPDGVYEIDTKYNDTVFIRTQAVPGDSWIFFNDAAARYLVATVVSADTMTFVGITDSVKKIKITSYTGSVVNTSDSFNNFEIILSKNNGFVRVFDLHLLPYNLVMDAYGGTDEDIFFTEITGGTCIATAGNCVFNISDYHKPTLLDVYAFEQGDVFFYRSNVHNFCPESFESELRYDSIAGKTVISPTETKYTIYEWRRSTYAPSGPGPITSHVDAYTSSLTADTSVMPGFTEEPEGLAGGSHAWYYHPADTSQCVKSAAYRHKNIVYFEGCDFLNAYKVGFLPTARKMYATCSPCPPNSTVIGCYCLSESNIDFSVKNEQLCGIRTEISAVADPGMQETSCIFPNPSTNTIHISYSQTIKHISLYNMLGQELLSQPASATTKEIDVSGLPTGVYLVKVNGIVTGKFEKR